MPSARDAGRDDFGIGSCEERDDKRAIKQSRNKKGSW